MKKNTMPLGALYDIVQGTYLKKQPNEEGVQCLVVRIQNLEGLEVAGEFAEEELAADKADRFRVQAGQIVVALRGMPLKAGVVGERHQGFVVNSNFAVLKPRAGHTLIPLPTGEADPYFVAGLLRSGAFNQHIAPQFAGNTLPSLKLSQLKKFEIPVVGPATQRQMGQVFQLLERYQKATADLLREREQQVESYIGQLLRGGLA